MCHFRRKPVISCIRILCLAIFFYSAVHISWVSLVSTLLLAGSIFLLEPYKHGRLTDQSANYFWRRNPLKGKPRLDESALVEETLQEVEHKICQMVTYDATNVTSLENFQIAKDNTQCAFAKKSRIWGSPLWQDELNLEENIYRSIPTFFKFTLLCKELGLDGFMYELPGKTYGYNLEVFGDGVRRLLTELSDNDPSGVQCMKSPNIGQKGWVFQFNRETYFVTTFAPFYSETHPRYSFGCQECYIFFQPEISFAQHDLPADTSTTNWEYPVTVRDRIRVAFKDAGRPYRIRDTIYYPIAHDIVKPMVDNGDVVEWWIPVKKNK